MSHAQAGPASDGVVVKTWWYATVGGLLFAAFALIVLSHAATNGLCCGDDGAIALVAKSVADGSGYSLPINFISESGDFVLHEGISTGPTLILPAAALIALFGNQPWAPSLASSLVSLGLLALLARLTARASDFRRGWIFLGSLVCMFYVLTAGEFFVHWYALLGEVPATLLLALAALFVAGCKDERSPAYLAFAAGCIAGLAVQSKLLALIGAMAIGGNFAWLLVADKQRSLAFRQGLQYLAGLLLPSALFEMYRWKKLGTNGYVEWLGRMQKFFGDQVPGSVESTVPVTGMERAFANLQQIDGRIGLTVASLAIPVLVLVLLGLRDQRWRATSAAALVCWASALANLLWWLFYSNGWPRYALIGVSLFVLSAAWAFASLRKVSHAFGAAFVVVLLLTPWQHLDRLAQPALYSMRNGFVENERVTALRAVGREIDGGFGRGSVLVGYWWPGLVPVEFIGHDSRRTVGFNRIFTARKNLRGTLLLRNPEWDELAKADADPSFRAFVSHCKGESISIPPYSLTRCDFSK